MPTLTIIALGSRGDVQPYVALGKGLADAGYLTRVVTFESFADLVASQGLSFHAVPGDAEALVRLAAGSGMMSRNPLRVLHSIQQSYAQLIDDYITAFSSESLMDSDGIINQLPGGLFGRDIAEALNVPHIMASVIPLIPTCTFPNPLLLAHPYNAWINRASYTFAAQAVWALFRRGIARFRKRLGLKAPPLLMPEPTEMVLNGFSARVVPRPPDWKSHVHVTGYWTLNEDGWTPPRELSRFLDSGPPPVFIGFGSMPIAQPERVTSLLITAMREAGVRGVLGKGWSQLTTATLPDDVFVLDYAPYAWLFPHTSAIVHHGGSGTTGFALRSGKPSLVISFTADQPYWGAQTQALGVGTAPIAFKQLSREALAKALTRIIHDRDMQERASRLSASLREEDGIARAVELVRGLVPL